MRLVPERERNEQNRSTPDVIEVDSMLIRDFFAGCALQGLASQPHQRMPSEIADAAYNFADAMMLRRN